MRGSPSGGRAGEQVEQPLRRHGRRQPPGHDLVLQRRTSGRHPGVSAETSTRDLRAPVRAPRPAPVRRAAAAQAPLARVSARTPPPPPTTPARPAPGQGRAGERARLPALGGRPQVRQHGGETRAARQFGRGLVRPVGLVDGDRVGQFDDPALESLQLVPGTGQQHQQEEVDHRADLRLALPHADGLDDDDVVAGGLEQDDRLARLARHAAQRAAGWRRADEGAGSDGQLLHARLVAEDAAAGQARRRVDRGDGHAVTAARSARSRAPRSGCSCRRRARR